MSQINPIDPELLRARDEEALSELFRDLAPTIRRAARSRVGSHDDIDVDDVVAEVFLALVRNPDRLAELTNSNRLRSYCIALTRNTVLHRLRRSLREGQARSAYESALEETDFSSSEPPMLDQELQTRIKRAIELLDDESRRIVVLYMQGRNADEVATLLNIQRGAVRVKYYRAMRRLRELIYQQTQESTG